MKLLTKVLSDLFKELEVPLSIGIESRYTIPICDRCSSTINTPL
jgi:hypothetical protein